MHKAIAVTTRISTVHAVHLSSALKKPWKPNQHRKKRLKQSAALFSISWNHLISDCVTQELAHTVLLCNSRRFSHPRAKLRTSSASSPLLRLVEFVSRFVHGVQCSSLIVATFLSSKTFPLNDGVPETVGSEPPMPLSSELPPTSVDVCWFTANTHKYVE